jgi:hypothetical protein
VLVKPLAENNGVTMYIITSAAPSPPHWAVCVLYPAPAGTMCDPQGGSCKAQVERLGATGWFEGCSAYYGYIIAVSGSVRSRLVKR